MSRYSSYEHDKIEYFKLKIKELRFLEREMAIVKEDLKTVEMDLRRVPSPNLRRSYKSKYEYKNNCALWNKLIMEKESLIIKEMNLSNAIGNIHRILDALTPATRDLAIDLFVNKKSKVKILDEYYTQNPYQTINDELRHIDIDIF